MADHSDTANAILSVGEPVRLHGRAGYALDLQQAREAMEKLRAAGLALLGGDQISVEREGEESFLLSNWFVDPARAESYAQYAQRSVDAGLQFLTHHSAEAGRFVLVVDPSGRLPLG